MTFNAKLGSEGLRAATAGLERMSFMDDDRELLAHGVTLGSLRNSQPLVHGYLPAAPVHRYSLKKWSKDDWRGNIEAKTFQASRDRQIARSVGDEAKELMKSVNASAEATQTEATGRLAERVNDVNQWKFELERAILDITAEMDNLASETRRTELALQAVQRPLSIASECLATRQRRVDSDLVQDDAEIELIHELEVATEVRSRLRALLEEAKHQQRLNAAAKSDLERDWSDKFAAQKIDSKSASLKNSRHNTMHQLGVATFVESESDPSYWLQQSEQTLRASTAERESSVRLRGQIDAIIRESTQILRQQNERVENALSNRISETELAIRSMESELKEVALDTINIESVIEDLKEALWDKQRFSRVAQSRLANRRLRPNVELCRDEATVRLVEEVRQLERDEQRLEDKMDEAEMTRDELNKTKLALEKELEIKRNSVQIDRERCLRARNAFPDSNTLSGYAMHSTSNA